ncbi:hypothetical protein [Hymenobacter persicinus]|uniref:STAS/SEC14 domain-containing protein n=1 Tax=Hymenobacter persicinus TaxID=2025506 RepID=A0A4Q5LC33_9BACT|nr:hypothetical protein [Hymenobacter persicinus]RYU78927.1 hypothetical protein EWM57_12140 [Hymenobacter persicinus]
MDLLRWKWRGSIDLIKFSQALDYLADFSQQHHVTRWLADTSDMPLVGIDEQVWLGEEWLPRFVRLGVSKIGLVLPLSLHNVLVIEHLMVDTQRYTPANLQFFSDSLAGLDWLTDSSPQIMALEQQWEQSVGCREPRPLVA